MSDLKFDEVEMRASLVKLNAIFQDLGLPKLDVVRPEDCLPQDVNARYMDQQMGKRLADNVLLDGRLESTPLVCETGTPGKYGTISGHHRIEAAIKARIKWIIVMVTTVKGIDELRAKQLSHNAIEGEDDEVVLRKMYEELSSLQVKLYSGLQDQLKPLNVVSLSFRAGSFQSFTVAFLPGDVEDYDRAVELVSTLPVTGSSVVRLGELPAYELFSKAIRDVKKVLDIKSSATSLSTLVELGMERLQQIKAEKAVEAAMQAAETPPEVAAPKTRTKKKVAVEPGVVE